MHSSLEKKTNKTQNFCTHCIFFSCLFKHMTNHWKRWLFTITPFYKLFLLLLKRF